MKYTELQAMRKEAADLATIVPQANEMYRGAPPVSPASRALSSVGSAIKGATRDVASYVTDVAKGIAADPKEFWRNVYHGYKAVDRNMPQFLYRTLEGGVDGVLSTPAMAHSYGGGLYNLLRGNGWKQNAVPEWAAAPMQWARNRLDQKFPNAGINRRLAINTGDRTVDNMLEFTAHSVLGGGLSYLGVANGLSALRAPAAVAKGTGVATSIPSLPAPYTR